MNIGKWGDDNFYFGILLWNKRRYPLVYVSPVFNKLISHRFSCFYDNIRFIFPHPLRIFLFNLFFPFSYSFIIYSLCIRTFLHILRVYSIYLYISIIYKHSLYVTSLPLYHIENYRNHQLVICHPKATPLCRIQIVM